VIGQALAGVVQPIGCAGDLDLLAKNLVLAFDNRAFALARVLLRLLGSWLPTIGRNSIPRW
jgi:hypothetical protein